MAHPAHKLFRITRGEHNNKSEIVLLAYTRTLKQSSLHVDIYFIIIIFIVHGDPHCILLINFFFLSGRPLRDCSHNNIIHNVSII